MSMTFGPTWPRHFSAASVGKSRAPLACRNERARSLLAPHTRCKVCIASGTNVYVRFCAGERGALFSTCVSNAPVLRNVTSAR
jgi:hypothetical protein